MRRFQCRQFIPLLRGKGDITDILADLATVETSQVSSKDVSHRPKLRKMKRKDDAESTIAFTQSERLNEAAIAAEKLHTEVSALQKKKEQLIKHLSTEGESNLPSVTAPPSTIPISSQEMRLEGGPQAFQRVSNTTGAKVNQNGMVAFAHIVGQVESPPVVLEDKNGLFSQISISYEIPLESGSQSCTIMVRGYGQSFIEYITALVNVHTCVNVCGFLMPHEASFVVVCTPTSGSLTII